jgi:hypothetical protein
MFRQSKFLRTLRNTATFDVREQISKLNAVALGTYVRNVGNGTRQRTFSSRESSSDFAHARRHNRRGRVRR